MVVVANVIDPLQDHCDPLNAHAECVASVDFGIDADSLEDFRIDHATAHNFEPLVAELTKIGRKEVHFEAWLGEWEEARAQTSLGLGAKNGLYEMIERGFEVEQRDVLIHVEALDLVKIRAVRGVWCVATEAATGSDDANRRLLLEHGADLHGRGVRAQ